MTRSAVRAPLLLSLLLVLPAPLRAAEAPAKDATAPTRDANAAVLKELPFADRGDCADARRGFIAALVEAPYAVVLKQLSFADAIALGHRQRDQAGRAFGPARQLRAALRHRHAARAALSA